MLCGWHTLRNPMGYHFKPREEREVLVVRVAGNISDFVIVIVDMYAQRESREFSTVVSSKSTG